MKNIEKYQEYQNSKHILQTGDILFTRGTSFLARSIQIVDNCYFNHCGVIFKSNDRYLLLEALGEGATISFLSKRIAVNKNFCVYRINGVTEEYKEEKINNLISNLSENKFSTSYDIGLFLKIAASRLLNGFKFTRNWFKSDDSSQKDICSETVRRFTDEIGISRYSKEKMLELTGKEWITPNDFLKYNDGVMTRII